MEEEKVYYKAISKLLLRLLEAEKTIKDLKNQLNSFVSQEEAKKISENLIHLSDELSKKFIFLEENLKAIQTNFLEKLSGIKIPDLSPLKDEISKIKLELTGLKIKKYENKEIQNRLDNLEKQVKQATEEFKKKIEEIKAKPLYKGIIGPLAGQTKWGQITGNLSDQTDLSNALNQKVGQTEAIAYSIALG
jgi:tetrahydromethanopterin S-methyltransferase subunit G